MDFWNEKHLGMKEFWHHELLLGDFGGNVADFGGKVADEPMDLKRFISSGGKESFASVYITDR